MVELLLSQSMIVLQRILDKLRPSFWKARLMLVHDPFLPLHGNIRYHRQRTSPRVTSSLPFPIRPDQRLYLNQRPPHPVNRGIPAEFLLRAAGVNVRTLCPVAIV